MLIGVLGKDDLSSRLAFLLVYCYWTIIYAVSYFKIIACIIAVKEDACPPQTQSHSH